jgi:hypothetical protein
MSDVGRLGDNLPYTDSIELLLLRAPLPDTFGLVLSVCGGIDLALRSTGSFVRQT